MARSVIQIAVLFLGVVACDASSADDNLQRDFVSPPDAARPWCYWWWLNGAASKQGITRDFEEMKKQGN